MDRIDAMKVFVSAVDEGSLAGAVESFRAALSRDANHAVAQTNLGIALARQGNRAAAASAYWPAITDLPPPAGPMISVVVPQSGPPARRVSSS